MHLVTGPISIALHLVYIRFLLSVPLFPPLALLILIFFSLFFPFLSD